MIIIIVIKISQNCIRKMPVEGSFSAFGEEIHWKRTGDLQSQPFNARFAHESSTGNQNPRVDRLLGIVSTLLKGRTPL
jgi:hypothetical protein